MEGLKGSYPFSVVIILNLEVSSCILKKNQGIWTRGMYFMFFGSFLSNIEILAITKMVVSLELPQFFQFWEICGHSWHSHTMHGCLANPDLAGRCREFHPKVVEWNSHWLLKGRGCALYLSDDALRQKPCRHFLECVLKGQNFSNAKLWNSASKA